MADLIAKVTLGVRRIAASAYPNRFQAAAEAVGNRRELRRTLGLAGGQNSAASREVTLKELLDMAKRGRCEDADKMLLAYKTCPGGLPDISTPVTLRIDPGQTPDQAAAETLKERTNLRRSLGLSMFPCFSRGVELDLRTLLLMAEAGASPDAKSVIKRDRVIPLNLSDFGLPLSLREGMAVLLKKTPLVEALGIAEGLLFCGASKHGAIERVSQVGMRRVPQAFQSRFGYSFSLAYPTEVQAKELAARYGGTTSGQEPDTIGGHGIRRFFLADSRPVADPRLITMWSLDRGAVQLSTNKAVKPYNGVVLVKA
ncbi:MAG: hypothetical protein NT099_04165 [Candidatus Saganbacteria bacterium]|nr:hypothetical protein [Candidatus Saganbacteria bacterium]